MRFGTLIVCLALSFAPLCCCTARAAGADPWGAEVERHGARAGAEQGPAARPVAKKNAPAPAGGKGDLTLSGDSSATIARLELDGDVAVKVFTLANPYRVIVDLTGATVPSQPKPGSGLGLVERYHSGRFEAGKSRIVMETLGPVKATAFPLVPGAKGAKVLEVAMTPMPVKEFGEGSGMAPPPPPPAPEQPAGGGGGISAGGVPPDFGAGLPGTTAPPPPARPVIVIDPGHGGIDPGAVGAESLLEKHIVLAVSEQLEQVLKAKDRYEVRMTRTSDVFVALDQRVAFSRKNAANLFISLHADSLEQSAAAQQISGATVYTLSERASDEQARIMA